MVHPGDIWISWAAGKVERCEHLKPSFTEIINQMQEFHMLAKLSGEE